MLFAVCVIQADKHYHEPFNMNLMATLSINVFCYKVSVVSGQTLTLTQYLDRPFIHQPNILRFIFIEMSLQLYVLEVKAL